MSLVAVWVSALVVAQLVGGLLLLYAIESTAKYFSKWWRRRCLPTAAPGAEKGEGRDPKLMLNRQSLRVGRGNCIYICVQAFRVKIALWGVPK